MEPVAHHLIGFAAAREWDIEQELSLTLEERLAIAEELKRRAFGESPPDVSEAERAR
ncbi:MAG: hypothetical protein HYZ53_22430 [Planctomycetes bacterium]|nr:hypothetical protein [Planctomycetota bacterium]